VDPASTTYIIGTPFFDSLSLSLPGASGPISIIAPGASKGLKYIKSLTLNGIPHNSFILHHKELANGAELVYEMSDVPQSWPN
jgi:putative alpha-1,2-mannosidase